MTRDDRDDDRHGDEEQELPATGQAERPPVRELDEVVEKADRPAGERCEEHGQRLEPEVADRQEGDSRREENQQPTHRGSPLLDEVAFRHLLPDVLAELVAAKEVDEPRPDHEGDSERHSGGDEDADHAPAPSKASATTSRPTDREPLTRIASPGRTRPSATPTASAAVGAHSSGA